MSETPPGGQVDNFAYDTATASVPAIIEDSTNAYIYGPQNTPIEQVPLSSLVSSTPVVDFIASDPTGMREISSFQMASGAPVLLGYEMCPHTTYGTQSCSSSGTTPPSTPIGYEDGYTDPSGLVYLINRNCDPSLRQFISVDPAYSQTHQLYGYANENPVNGSDPSGMLSCNPGRAAAPWSNGVLSLSQRNRVCAARMGINWLFNNTVGPLIGILSATAKGAARELAVAIVTSTNAALMVIWMDEFGFCGRTLASGCDQSYSCWITSGLASPQLAIDPAWLLNWITRINMKQAVAKWPATAFSEGKTAGGIPLQMHFATAWKEVEYGLVGTAILDILNKTISAAAGSLAGDAAQIIEKLYGIGTYASPVT